jgi:hypothetical protein
VLKARYVELGEETERHVEIDEQLIIAMGGNPSYVSPMARAVELTDSKTLEATFLLAGSVDVMTAEMVMLDAVFLAESMCHHNWAADMRAKLVLLQADHCVAAVAGQEVEELVATVKGWFADAPTA